MKIGAISNKFSSAYSNINRKNGNFDILFTNTNIEYFRELILQIFHSTNLNSETKSMDSILGKDFGKCEGV